MTEQITINGQTYVQAVHVVQRDKNKTLIPAHDKDGNPVYALPGGGRATEKELWGRGR